MCELALLRERVWNIRFPRRYWSLLLGETSFASISITFLKTMAMDWTSIANNAASSQTMGPTSCTELIWGTCTMWGSYFWMHDWRCSEPQRSALVCCCDRSQPNAHRRPLCRGRSYPHRERRALSLKNELCRTSKSSQMSQFVHTTFFSINTHQSASGISGRPSYSPFMISLTWTVHVNSESTSSTQR